MDKYRLEEHQQLLQSLKATVEGLLISQVSNVWNIYGGLNRLYNAMKNIFKHGCRVFTQDGDPDCWVFIQGLTWLQPALANSPTFFCEDKDTFVHLPKGVTNDKASYWLFKSLEGHTLSQKLSWLLSDRSHLSSCFEPYAFLCRREYGEAALVCLRAVEQSQPSLLTEIDPCLYLTRWKWQPFHKTHRRCSSFPETFRNRPWNERFDDGNQTNDYQEETPAIPVLVKDIKSDKDRVDGALRFDSSVYQNIDNTEKQEMSEKVKLKSNRHSLDSGIRNPTTENENKSTKCKARERRLDDNLKVMVDMGRCWSSLPSLIASKKEEEVRGRSSTMISSVPAKNNDASIGEFFQFSSFNSDQSTNHNKTDRNRSSHGGNVETSTSDCFAYQGKKQDIPRPTPRFCLPDETLMSELPNSPRNLLPAAASQRPCQLHLQASWVEEDKGVDTGEDRIDPDFSAVVVGSAPVGYGRENWQRRETQNHHASNVTWQRNHGNPGMGHENSLSLLMGSSISSSSLTWRGGPVSGIWSNRYRQSFLEAGGCGVVPMWTGFFPQPARGQSLTSFLSSGQFARSAAELDRENAHFVISEAMIAAVEQVKSNRQLGINIDGEDNEEVTHKEEESDEEINQLKQRIRLRRRQLRQQKERNNQRYSEWNVPNSLSDGKNDTTTTEQSISPFSSSSVGSFHSSTPSSSSTSPTYSLAQSPSFNDRRKRNGSDWRRKGESSQSSVEELTLDDNVNGLTSTRDAGLSLSLASLYSDADLSHRQSAKASSGNKMKKNLQKSEKLCRLGNVKVMDEASTVSLAEAASEVMPSDGSEGDEKNVAVGEGGVPVDCNQTVVSLSSAEGVALSLLRRFSEKKLPRASELEWLVSEIDAPQQLLPLPGSWPVSPDEAEDEDMKQATPLRGTFEWAPPRPQIIFTPHPSPNHRVVMAKQGHRCAGCGMKVAPEYAHRFRYCEYLGRYFCTGCHSNQLALIPGRVLSKWDFTRCPVSIFSYRLLEQMLSDPLYNVGDLNPALYRKAKALERTRTIRTQLHHLREFLLACRFAIDLQECLEREPQYLTSDPEVYSLQDLVSVKSGELPARLKTIVDAGIAHVAQCQLCMARGFVCELCGSPEIIHPWQLSKVSRCAGCGACFHSSCRDESKNSKKKGKPPDGAMEESNPPCPRCARLWKRQRQRMQPKQSEDEVDETVVKQMISKEDSRKNTSKLQS